jgi:hypothetical protein
MNLENQHKMKMKLLQNKATSLIIIRIIVIKGIIISKGYKTYKIIIKIIFRFKNNNKEINSLIIIYQLFFTK